MVYYVKVPSAGEVISSIRRLQELFSKLQKDVDEMIRKEIKEARLRERSVRELAKALRIYRQMLQMVPRIEKEEKAEETGKIEIIEEKPAEKRKEEVYESLIKLRKELEKIYEELQKLSST